LALLRTRLVMNSRCAKMALFYTGTDGSWSQLIDENSSTWNYSCLSTYRGEGRGLDPPPPPPEDHIGCC